MFGKKLNRLVGILTIRGLFCPSEEVDKPGAGMSDDWLGFKSTEGLGFAAAFEFQNIPQDSATP